MSTQTVRLTVNGEAIFANVEPRMHLGDFVRRELGLTGTHLSCEHGVCGACTVLIDGQPQRSCITFAVACAGSSITTIEGYDNDPVMAALRRAFHEHHALQCGYCTPGMLCTARDIVLRLPGPDARRVRHELAGNLCRCTGYVGIVEAIDSVLIQKASGVLIMPVAGTTATTTMAATPITTATTTPMVPTAVTEVVTTTAIIESGRNAISSISNGSWQPVEIAPDGEWVEVRQSLTLPLPAERVWRQLCDLPHVANCLPGARITAHAGDRAEGIMNIKFGPITANFMMRAELTLDDIKRTGQMRAEGTDRRSATRVKTLLDYSVTAASTEHSNVGLLLRFRLAGPLAQFSRSGLVNDYVTELTRLFGQNLSQSMSADSNNRSPVSTAPAGPNLLRLLWLRVRRWFGSS